MSKSETEKKSGNNSKKIIIAVVGVLVLIAAIVGMMFLSKSMKDEPVEGSKSITIEVKSERDNYDFSQVYKTDYEYLGDFLEEKELIGFDRTEYGRFIKSVQGFASNDEEQSWWSVAVNGESAMTGVDEIILEDGSVYTLELKIGW